MIVEQMRGWGATAQQYTLRTFWPDFTLDVYWVEVPEFLPRLKKKCPARRVHIGVLAHSGDFTISMWSGAVQRRTDASGWSWQAVEVYGNDPTRRLFTGFDLHQEDVEAFAAAAPGKVTGPWREIPMHDAVVFEHMLRRAVARYFEWLETQDHNVLRSYEVVVP